jgi:hypothetical protein
VWGGGVGAVVLIAVVLTWLLWPEDERRTPRAEQFRDVDVCVLVGQAGITAEPTASAWSALREVAAEAEVRLSYLTVAGPQTQAQAQLFVPTLVQQGCDVIVGSGQIPAAAVRELSGTYPDLALLTVESDADAAGVAQRVRELVAP